MTDNKLRVSVLCDIYGDLLTQKQREALEMYCNDDFSLSEIAENTGISRQGVRDQIKHAEAQLNTFEQKLGLFNKFSEVSKLIGEIAENEEVKQNAEVSVKLAQIRDILSLD